MVVSAQILSANISDQKGWSKSSSFTLAVGQALHTAVPVVFPNLPTLFFL
jgi:hypothetical protein